MREAWGKDLQRAMSEKGLSQPACGGWRTDEVQAEAILNMRLRSLRKRKRWSCGPNAMPAVPSAPGWRICWTATGCNGARSAKEA